MKDILETALALVFGILIFWGGWFARGLNGSKELTKPTEREVMYGYGADGDGGGRFRTAATSASGSFGLYKPNCIYYPHDDVYIIPDDVEEIKVTAVGGSGSSGFTPGGNGARSVAHFRRDKLPEKIEITIGRGGQSGGRGGDTKFGTLLIAYGGGAALDATEKGADGYVDIIEIRAAKN